MLILAVVLVLFMIYGIYIYNTLVHGLMLVQEAWSGVDVQLKRRTDLIPALVEVVKAYAQYERALFEKVADLRSQLGGDKDVLQRSVLENNVSRALKTILAVVESYPDLKANNNFLELQRSLVQVEDNIQLARRYFNGTVRDFNILAGSFPGNIVAGFFHFEKRTFFELESSLERQAPVVKGLG